LYLWLGSPTAPEKEKIMNTNDLMNLSAVVLRRMANEAVVDFHLDPSWTAPRTNDREELVAHLDQMCNEFNLTAAAGRLERAA
jgi:hypothetical protein